jgi:S1-C subfamily serine protease
VRLIASPRIFSAKGFFFDTRELTLKTLNFSIRPRSRGIGFVVISEELGFVIPQLSESDAIEYAKSRAPSQPLQLDIYDAEGNLVRRIAILNLANNDPNCVRAAGQSLSSLSRLEAGE